MFDLEKVDFAKGSGVVTVVAQHAVTGEVLMIAQADREALLKTLSTGEMYYRSRTRGLWHKGATSGNTQRVIGLQTDCDGDAILARVIPNGPACHTGSLTCFGDHPKSDALAALDTVIESRGAHDVESSSYTRRLLEDRNLRLKKLGEEVAELVTSLADGDSARAADEAADLFYHTLVALRAVGVGLRDLQEILARRSKV